MSEIFQDLFIFEMANNHQGSLEHGLRIIEEMTAIAKKHGIRAGVKFQYRHLDTFIHPAYKDRDDVKHIPRFTSTRLTDEQFLTMVERVRQGGLLPIITPFDEASVDTCVEHDIPILKVASCSATDWPLLEAVAQTGRPVIISTGGLSIYEVDNIVSFFTHHEADFALLHCVAIYPTPNHLLQMGFLSRMKRRYPKVPIGYSGHEAPTNVDAVKVAVSMGAALLERHVGLPTDTITLNKYSMAPKQVDAWVRSALCAREIGSNGGARVITDAEVNALRSLKRGVYAARRIKKGRVIVSVGKPTWRSSNAQPSLADGLSQ